MANEKMSARYTLRRLMLITDQIEEKIGCIDSLEVGLDDKVVPDVAKLYAEHAADMRALVEELHGVIEDLKTYGIFE